MVPTIARRHIFLFLDCIVTDNKLGCMYELSLAFVGTRRLYFNVAIFCSTAAAVSVSVAAAVVVVVVVFICYTFWLKRSRRFCTQTQPMWNENNGPFFILLWKVKTIFCSRLFLSVWRVFCFQQIYCVGKSQRTEKSERKKMIKYTVTWISNDYSYKRGSVGWLW